MSSEQLLFSYLPNEDYTDDLNSILLWLHPEGNQSRPPSLRLKNCIRRISEIQNDEFSQLFTNYYMDIVREEYLSAIGSVNNGSAIKFNDILSLEKRLAYPCTFIPGLNDQLSVTIDNLRHYVIDNNAQICEMLINGIRTMTKNDDLDLVDPYVNWIDSSQASSITSKDVILDIMVEKISDMCHQTMCDKWANRYLVMEVFNQFIEKYWSQFARLLECPEDNHSLTTTVYECFEDTFIKIRTSEIYRIVIESYPTSIPTILELKKVLRNNKHKVRNYNTIIYTFLQEFEKQVLNPSVTTVDILLAYIKSMRCFMLLDSSGRYVKPLKIFVKPYFKQRKDLINILLWAILDLHEQEFKDLGIEYVKDIEKLSAGLSSGSDQTSSNSHKMDRMYDAQYKSPRQFSPNSNTSRGGVFDPEFQDRLVYENVLQQFLSWVPEPNTHNDLAVHAIQLDTDGNLQDSNVSISSIPEDTSNNLPSTGKSYFLDILLEPTENKEQFIAEFMNVLTKKLMALKAYKLDSKWASCLRFIRRKYSRNDTGTFLGNSGSTMDNNAVDENNNREHNVGADIDGFSFNMNKIDVMLYDMKSSEVLYNHIQQRKSGAPGDVQIFPKFISTMYWEPEDVSPDKAVDSKAASKKYRYAPSLENSILQYAYEFSKVETNKALHFCRDAGTMEIEIEMGQPNGKPMLVKLDVTVPQYCVIQAFSTSDTQQQPPALSVDELSALCRIPAAELPPILQFWVSKHMLLYDIHSEKYTTNEQPPASKASLQPPTMT